MLGVHETLVSEAKQPPVWVYAPVASEDIDAFTRAAGITPDGLVDSIADHEDEDFYEVSFQLPQGPPKDVFAKARAMYEDICARASLHVPDPLELRASGFDVFLPRQGRDEELLTRADDLFHQGHHDLAVIVAQTACEVLIADAMRALIAQHATTDLREWLGERVTSYTLVDDPTRKLWNRLTATEIQKQEWWETYKTHVKRRHRIVHAG